MVKAAFFNQPGSPLELKETAKPTAKADEVVVQVSYCGICSSDLHMTDGKGAYTAPAGAILGHEISGTVVELGADASGLKVGDHVAVIPVSGCEQCEFCDQGDFKKCANFSWREGGYSQFIVSKPRYCFRLADHLPLSDGALVEPMAVALRALRHASLNAGQKLLILGAGPIGLSCTYWARHFGCEAIVLASSTRRKSLALEMGAHAFIANKNGDLETILDKCEGAPDVVIECTGVQGMISLAIDIVKPHSTIVIPGWCTQPDSFLPMTAMGKELRLQFTALYSSDDFQYVIDTMAADKQAKYRAMNTASVPLNELPTTFESLRSSNDAVKIMVRPDV